MRTARGLLAGVAFTLTLGLLTSSLIPSRTGRAQEDESPIKTVAGSEPGVRADILSLKRTEGGLLTLRIAYVNETGGEVKNKALPGSGSVDRLALFDFANKRKYPVLYTSDGACLCTSLNPLNSFEPGQRVLWAKFTAPPQSVTRVSLLFPDAEPIDGVPISN